MAQEEISEEGSREANNIMADRTEDYLESLLTDAFKGKGFQKISELLQEKEVKPLQKYSGTLLSQLDKAVRKELDRNEFTNVSLLLKCVQLYFKSDLQEGKSLFVEQGVVEKVLTDSFGLYLVSWFERARGFVILIDTNENQFLMLLLEDFFDTALVICRCSHEGKKELVNLFLPVLGHLVTEANVVCALRQEALRTLNSILDSVPREERKKFPLSEEMCSLTKDLAKAILEAGDYDLQVALSEALCRLMTKKWRDDLVHHWFEDNYLAEAFKEIKDREFETDCRKFLNQLNERLGNQRRVYSFPCISAYADMNEVKKPSDEKLEKFWIDFNMGSQCVTFYVDSSEGALWDSVKLTKEAVSSYSLKEDAGEKVVKIYMKVPATLSQTEATKVKITFSAQFDIFSVLKRVLGEEKLMMQMAEEESVQAGKQARQNETGMPVSTDSQVRKDPSNSENTDSVSENLTSLPSQQLTGPVPKTVDSGITVIPLSLQTDEEDDHQDSANMPKTPSPRMKANPSEKPLEEPMEESTAKKDVIWEKRNRRRSAKQRTEGRKEIYGFENSDSASNEKVAESKGTNLGLKMSSQNQRTSELGTKNEVPNHLERKLSNYRKHLFSESNNENTSTSQSEKSWILDSQKQSLPRSQDYTRKRPRLRSKLKVLPVSSASSDSDYQSEKHRTSRRRPQKRMPRKESTLISKDGDLSTVNVAEETLSEELEDGPITIEEPAKGYSREEKAPQQFQDAPAEMSRETESLKWEDSDVLGSTAIKKPKFSSWETSHPSSDTPFKPRKHFDLVDKEANIQTGQEMHNKVDDALFSKILQEDLSGSGVVAAFESFTGQLKKLFWSRYKNMEISAQNSLRASEKNVSALLNQIHECRLSKLETFQKIVAEELASLEKETQILLNMEKDAVDFWNTQLFKLNSFCNQQKQRIQSVDSALGESARSFSDSIQNTTHGQPTKAVESEVFVVPSD